MRLAIVDRDAELIAALGVSAARLGWDSHVLRRAVGGRQLALMGVDALVFDPAALPGREPWAWVAGLKTRLPDLALVVCSAHSTVDERIDALSLGIDDWLVKPADPDELLVRIARLVRRSRRFEDGPVGGKPVRAGELEVDPARHQIFVAGEGAGLTRREYEVFAAIARGGGAVVGREEIFLGVWGYAMGRSDRSVDVYVGKLRAKLMRVSPDYVYIHTHHRVGYRIEPQRRVEVAAGPIEKEKA